MGEYEAFRSIFIAPIFHSLDLVEGLRARGGDLLLQEGHRLAAAGAVLARLAHGALGVHALGLGAMHCRGGGRLDGAAASRRL